MMKIEVWGKYRGSIHPHMPTLDRLCIIASAMAQVGYKKEAMEMAKTCKGMWTYKPLWGLIKDVRGPSGRTRLMYCAEHGDVERLEWLIRHGANPDIQDGAGYTALHLAISNWKEEAAMALIVAGGNLNLKTVADGLRAQDSIYNRRTYGETPLMLACMRSTELVSFLCHMGAEVRRTNFQGQPAMHYALVAGNIDSAMILQKYGAKIPKASAY
jgi:ankyrin repeat protein